MSRNNHFKNSKTYKILVACFFVLYLAYRIYTGVFADPAQDVDSGYAQEHYQESSPAEIADVEYMFRNEELLDEHFEKHGIEMGFDDEEAYLQAANLVLSNEDTLYKTEAEDGDHVYYLEATNEFVVVSKDGYIRTYFYPEDGIEYFNRQ